MRGILFWFGPQFISEFECRQWSFVLLPDRPTRLIGHTCCFKSLINEFSPIALKFMVHILTRLAQCRYHTQYKYRPLVVHLFLSALAFSTTKT